MGSGASKHPLTPALQDADAVPEAQASLKSSENAIDSEPEGAAHTSGKERDGNQQSSFISSDNWNTKPVPGRFKLEEDEEQEEIESLLRKAYNGPNYKDKGGSSASTLAEPDDICLAFESFLHNDGTLYTCITQSGTKLYFDETKGLVPFPEEWLQHGKFINSQNELKDAELGSTREVEELRTLYRKEALERKLLYDKLQEIRGNIRVFCRCRGDSNTTSSLTFPSDEEILVIHNGSKKKLYFDKVYAPDSTQEEVFEGTLPIITSCVDGFSVCILAYGQTGSGKTYTMMGPKDNPGVNIRSIRELLHLCQKRETIKYTLKISMLEIYNETVQDLLSKSNNHHLEIRTWGKTISIPGLTEIEVTTEDEIRNVMNLGEKNRTIASTKMNIESSRSHLMLILRVDGVDSISGVVSHGSLTVCDLAGSERISKTEATGQRLVEAAAINKSLTSLGQVFMALKNSALHIPYRNSKLTHLLQPCLSGDAKACVFVNISPDGNNIGETMNTLQFGSSIRQVALGKVTQHVTTIKSGN
ncbi:uncharacterized protein LOC102356132 [Latimeria chalumnae]|uniref:uncharacterized protein LOC102356132 n=1 Tax=Latimeria chalumnae TaxID=7897 RepID=UPI00313C29CD